MRIKKLQREEAILSSLAKHDYLSRRQLQRMHQLQGDRNARRVLENLSECVSSFRIESGENVFHLNKAGRERVGCQVVRNKTVQTGHYLMRNDAFLFYGGSEDWKNEMRFHVEGVVTLFPDSYFRHNGRRHFLEADHLQHMVKNREKIAKYRKLSETGVLQERLKYFPRLVWVTLTESRRKKLLEWCSGMDVVVHLWDEIK